MAWSESVVTSTAMVKKASPSKWLAVARCRRPVVRDSGPGGGVSHGPPGPDGPAGADIARCGPADEAKLDDLQQGSKGEGGEFGGHEFCFELS